ncbi:hypothetical protein Dda_8638 [Drechslerella dactyloides]|uniref:WD repeat protein n=1 Tax=Drechslerella dactyloides TaxID=74499 RepID=A0AAD6ITZ2_DREDA|nr:hypothetical protein Dda_8638 [Drechslerella dactyloides]
MRSTTYVGPVTSLAFLDGNLLAAGHGSYLKLFKYTFDDSKFVLEWRKQVFKRERIQGIQFSLADIQADESQAAETRALLWGGKRFQIISRSGLLDPNSSIDCEDEIPTPDWILHATFLRPEDNVAEIAIITAHNTILKYRHDIRIPLAQRFRSYPSPERCLLYSAYITLDHTAAASNTLLALAGTVFGEVLLWKLDLSKPAVEKTPLIARYLSHEGSVFGVSVSRDLVYTASCSDDRTIQLWDISESKGNQSNEVCKVVKSPLAVGWGHQARIWGVHFLEPSNGNVRLISYSEDLTAKIWSFDRASSNKSLVCVQTCKSLHSASGKNIWSLAVRPSEDVFVTGGADSGIASWRIDNAARVDKTSEGLPEEKASWTSITETVFDLAELFPPANPPTGKKAVKEEPLKYVALGDHSYLVTTSFGCLRHCDLSMPAGKQWTQLGLWPQIRNSAAFGAGKSYHDGMCKYTVGLADNEGKLLFLQCGESALDTTATDQEMHDWVQICNSRPSDIVFSECSLRDSKSVYAAVTTFRADEPVRLLRLTTTERKPIVQMIWQLLQPDTFPITTILVVKLDDRQVCLAGSRHGAFALYDISEGEEGTVFHPVRVWRHVHDDDSVTSMSHQPSHITSPAHNGNIYHLNIISTGRSGACRFHKLSIDSLNALYTLDETNVVYPAATPRLENHHSIRSPNTDESHEILSGFRGRDFVLWNQTLGIEAVSFDCEGGHRSWDFSFAQNTSRSDTGLFVFSKSKKCHAVRFANVTHDPLIQTPFHGREIKALAVSPAVFRPPNCNIPQQVIATGAEDTTIRFSYVTPDASELVTLTTRKSHTTGIQDLVWSSCGGWLFSSGSVEEVYCWKINYASSAFTAIASNTDAQAPRAVENSNSIHTSAIGVVREAVYDLSNSSSSDLRVCGLDVATVHGSAGDDSPLGFLVGMVRSDSSIKLAFYNVRDKRFVTIIEGVYKTSCLLQIRFCITVTGRVLMLTAGTDGHVTVWDITDSVITCGITVMSQTLRMEAFAELDTPVKLQMEQRVLCQQLHQNSVKTLATVEMDDGNIILLTGSDDTAICISKLGISASGSIDITSKLLERAHASAVTTITVLSVTKDSLEFISAGVDQQVKTWKVGLGDDMKDSSVVAVEDFYVGIPDVAATALLVARDGEARKLLVGGVGVEILEI